MFALVHCKISKDMWGWAGPLTGGQPGKWFQAPGAGGHEEVSCILKETDGRGSYLSMALIGILTCGRVSAAAPVCRVTPSQ